MITIGTLVTIIHPNYVKGIEGIIKAKESEMRWLVQLDFNPTNDRQELILLSLNESEFKVLNKD